MRVRKEEGTECILPNGRYMKYVHAIITTRLGKGGGEGRGYVQWNSSPNRYHNDTKQRRVRLRYNADTPQPSLKIYHVKEHTFSQKIDPTEFLTVPHRIQGYAPSPSPTPQRLRMSQNEHPCLRP